MTKAVPRELPDADLLLVEGEFEAIARILRQRPDLRSFACAELEALVGTAQSRDQTR